MRAFLTAAAILAAGQAQAATLDFKFSFNTWNNGWGHIVGYVRGLHDNATTVGAQVEVFSTGYESGVGVYQDLYPDEFGVPDNSWTVRNGKLLTFVFYGKHLADDGAIDATIELHRWISGGVPGVQATFGPYTYGPEITALKFDPGFTSVPLPATGLLMAGALLMLRQSRFGSRSKFPPGRSSRSTLS